MTFHMVSKKKKNIFLIITSHTIHIFCTQGMLIACLYPIISKGDQFRLSGRSAPVVISNYIKASHFNSLSIFMKLQNQMS